MMKFLYSNIYIFILIVFSLASLSCSNDNKPHYKDSLKKVDKRPIDEYGQRYVVGHLGSKKVNLPSPVAGIVEYSGSPFWSKTSKYIPRSERTYNDAITSFGFDMRMDGMLHQTYYKTPEDSRIAYQQEERTPQSQWLSVGILANEHYVPYYGVISFDEYIERLEYKKSYPWFQTQLQDNMLYGLYIFLRPDVINPNTGKSWREDDIGYVITYVSVKNGIVQTIIDCNPNSQYENARTCTQRFSLDPEWQTEIYVSYKIALLPRWQEIEALIKAQMNKFVINEVIS